MDGGRPVTKGAENGQGVEQASGRLMKCLPRGPDRAGSDKRPCVLGHRGPPKVLPEEIQGSGKARVTGEEGGVPPLEDL